MKEREREKGGLKKYSDISSIHVPSICLYVNTDGWLYEGMSERGRGREREREREIERERVRE